MDLFAHHNEAHTLGMREVAIFATAIVLMVIVIKVVGANK